MRVCARRLRKRSIIAGAVSPDRDGRRQRQVEDCVGQIARPNLYVLYVLYCNVLYSINTQQTSKLCTVCVKALTASRIDVGDVDKLERLEYQVLYPMIGCQQVV
jgi:hypothetical protein